MNRAVSIDRAHNRVHAGVVLAVVALGCSREPAVPATGSGPEALAPAPVAPLAEAPPPAPAAVVPEPTPLPVPPTPAAPEPASLPAAPTDAAGLVDLLHAAFNAHDLSRVAALHAEDAVLETIGVPMPPVRGRAAIVAMGKVTFAGFPDARLRARRVFDFGDVIAIQEVFSGTHDGTYMGKAATHKRASMEILRVLSWSGGQIRRVREYQNLTALLAQIGVLPAAAPPPPLPTLPPGPPEVVTGSAHEGVVTAVRRVVTAVMAPGVRGLADAVAGDFAYHDFVEGRDYVGLEDNAKSLLAWRAAFSDLAIVAEEQWAAGAWVVTLSRITAKHTGDLGARLKATGKVVVTHSADVARVADGRQAEGWGYADPAELLIQLGALPPVPTVPEPPRPTSP